MHSVNFDLFPGGHRKALTMSYDDGVIQDRRLVEIFNRHGIRGTFHLTSGHLGYDRNLSREEVAALFAGHEVSGHSVTHPRLEFMPREQIVEEIIASRRSLEELVGYPVRGISYPFGTYSSCVLEILQSLGIEYARTVASHGTFGLPDNFLTWGPTCHHKGNLLQRAREFKALDPRHGMMLMYVWGHSYEFDGDANWDLIEEFCMQMANQSTIWYATNIEIVDYMKARQRMRCTIDGSVIQNPNATSVWASIDGRRVEIPAGATVNVA